MMDLIKRRLAEPSTWAGLSMFGLAVPPWLPDAAGAAITGNWIQLALVLVPALIAMFKSDPGNGGAMRPGEVPVHPAHAANPYMNYDFRPADVPPSQVTPQVTANHPAAAHDDGVRRVQNFGSEPIFQNYRKR